MMYPALPPLFSFSPSFLFSPLFLWEEPTGFTWKHQKITGGGIDLVAPGKEAGSQVASRFFARGHQVNAAQGNFLVLPGETRGPLPRKRRGKEKRGEGGEIYMDAISSRSQPVNYYHYQ